MIQDIDKKLIYDHLIHKNEKNFNLLKAAEELQELSLALTQFITKEDVNDDRQIIEEIGDVKIRLKVLEKIFDKDKIQNRINYKLNKFLNYINKNKYKNI